MIWESIISQRDVNYYEYLVRNSIYPSFSTVDELRKAVEEQLEADINAIGIALRRSPELAEKFGEYSFFSQDPQEVLENLQEAIAEEYPQLPDSEYRIKYVPESLEDSMSPAFLYGASHGSAAGKCDLY